jgi:hypothetical protein
VPRRSNPVRPAALGPHERRGVAPAPGVHISGQSVDAGEVSLEPIGKDLRVETDIVIHSFGEPGIDRLGPAVEAVERGLCSPVRHPPDEVPTDGVTPHETGIRATALHHGDRGEVSIVFRLQIAQREAHGFQVVCVDVRHSVFGADDFYTRGDRLTMDCRVALCPER